MQSLLPQQESDLLESMLTAAWEQALSEKIANKTTFADWLLHISPELHWDWPYIRYVREHLDRITSGKIHKLMIFMPPQHGKSALATIRYPVYRLERNPALRIIVGAYNQFLSEKFSRQARRLASYRMQLSPERTAAYDWETQQGGGMRAAGVGSGVTGIGGDLIIIDDPVKSREEAESQAYRDRVWDWYSNDLYTRQGPDAAFILIMCMTGDTPVLMADGTERPLREIKVGDQVATYDNGRLATSTVRNHRSNGLDSVFGIKTTCGKIVYANERHPFLVEEHGQLKWMRLKNLTTAHKIVTVKDSGASGKARPVSSMAAKNLLAVGDTARHTTARRCGPMGIVPHRLTQSHAGMRALSTATESPPLSMTQCSRRKVESALSANSLHSTMCERIGLESCALTTAMTPTPSEGFCATTVILPWDTPSQKQLHSLWPNTSDFTTEAIASIEPAGIEEVFDVQIERTENFIANGLVSHNTRWHEDDLAGHLLKEQAGQWTLLRLPAFAETQEERDENNRHMGLPLGEADPLRRQPGAALAPQRYSAAGLGSIRRDVGPMVWGAEYQGSPRAPEGNLLKRAWLSQTAAAAPATPWRVRYWDKAASTSATAKFSAGVRLSITPDGRVTIEHVVRGQWTTQERRRVMKQTAEQDARDFRNSVLIYIEQEPGSSGLDSVQDEIRLLAGLPVFADRPSGDKDTRLMPFIAQAAAANVWLLDGAWQGAYIDELVAVPTGYYRDQADATAGAYNRCMELIDILPAGTIVIEEPVQISPY